MNFLSLFVFLFVFLFVEIVYGGAIGQAGIAVPAAWEERHERVVTEDLHETEDAFTTSLFTADVIFVTATTSDKTMTSTVTWAVSFETEESHETATIEKSHETTTTEDPFTTSLFTTDVMFVTITSSDETMTSTITWTVSFETGESYETNMPEEEEFTMSTVTTGDVLTTSVSPTRKSSEPIATQPPGNAGAAFSAGGGLMAVAMAVAGAVAAVVML